LPYITALQWFAGINAMIVAIAGYLDRKRSMQAADAIVAICGALFLLFVATWEPGKAFLVALGIPQDALPYLTSLITIAVIVAMAYAGTLDFSPIGIFLGIMGLIGGVWLSSLGDLGTMLKLPQAPLVTLDQLAMLIQLKQMDLAKFSLTIYSILLIGIIFYGVELVRPDKKIKVPTYGGLLLAVLTVVAYIGLRQLARMPGDLAILGHPIVAFLVVLVINLLLASNIREQGDTVTNTGWAEYKIGLLKITSPWDIIAFEAMLGGFIAIAVGRI
jgi:hypothetical protein